MRQLLALALKSQRFILPALAFLLCFQLLMGQVAADARAQRLPQLVLALQDCSEDAGSRALTASLASATSFTLRVVDPALSVADALEATQAHGLLVILPQYQERAARQENYLVRMHTAPGVSDTSFLVDQVSFALLDMQARDLLASALDELGADAVAVQSRESIDLLEVQLVGAEHSTPAAQATEPLHSVAALLLLLAWLHALLAGSAAHSRHVRARGIKAFWRQLLCSQSVAVLLWGTLVLLYALFSFLLTGVPPSASTLAALLTVALFATLAGTLLALLLTRNVAAWLFVPLFLANMGIGGGIWGGGVADWYLLPLVPVSVVSAAETGNLLPVAALLCWSALVAAVLLLAGTRFGGASTRPV